MLFVANLFFYYRSTPDSFSRYRYFLISISISAFLQTACSSSFIDTEGAEYFPFTQRSRSWLPIVWYYYGEPDSWLKMCPLFLKAQGVLLSS